MTAKEAYQIILERWPDFECAGCGECEEFFTFGRKDYVGGTPTVDKKTGEIGGYNPIVDDFKMFDRLKSVPLEQLGIMTKDNQSNG